MARRNLQTYRTLREAILAAGTPEPQKASEIIKQALAMWTSPAGKTPKASAGTAMLNLTRKGLLVKVAPAMYALAPQEPAPTTKPRKRKAT